MKHFQIFWLLGAAAIVGFCLPTPIPSDYFHPIRFIDAALTIFLGALAWTVFHLVEPVHHGKRWVVIRETAIPVVWVLLTLLLYLLFQYLSSDFWKAFAPLISL
jgi:glucose-6-phosphate-specific signal transduction histidine kinase